METKKNGTVKLVDLKLAILEFLLENTDKDRYANTGKRVFTRLKEIFGDKVKRTTVYYNLKALADDKLLETKQEVVRGDKNQPNTVVRYIISDRYKERIANRVQETRLT